MINKKDVWRELTSHKFEESESVQSLQKLQDGIFALSEICVAKRGLHVQNRPEGYTSAFLYTKIHGQGTCTSSCAYALIWNQLPEYCIHKIIKGSNLSFETSDHNLSPRFIDFGKQCERNIYGKGLCDLLIATSRLCDKSEACVRSWLIVNSETMTLPLPEEKIGKIKDQRLRLYKASKVSILYLAELIGRLSSTIQAVLPGCLQFRFLQQQQIVSLTSCDGGSTIWNFAIPDWLYKHMHRSLFRQTYPKKGRGTVFRGIRTGGQWSKKERNLNIS